DDAGSDLKDSQNAKSSGSWGIDPLTALRKANCFSARNCKLTVATATFEQPLPPAQGALGALGYFLFT
ncbi:MAG: hypothetical protein Q9218_007028, partial [Villophora microphyllina]